MLWAYSIFMILFICITRTFWGTPRGPLIKQSDKMSHLTIGTRAEYYYDYVHIHFRSRDKRTKWNFISGSWLIVPQCHPYISLPSNNPAGRFNSIPGKFAMPRAEFLGKKWDRDSSTLKRWLVDSLQSWQLRNTIISVICLRMRPWRLPSED